MKGQRFFGARIPDEAEVVAQVEKRVRDALIDQCEHAPDFPPGTPPEAKPAPRPPWWRRPLVLVAVAAGFLAMILVLAI